MKTKKYNRESSRNRRLKIPWETSFYMARYRCENKQCHDYIYYGGRGIKFLITMDEWKRIWIRDKANLLRKPSIDRINPDGNYQFNNCRFIELSDNCARRRITEKFLKSCRKSMANFNKKRRFKNEKP